MKAVSIAKMCVLTAFSAFVLSGCGAEGFDDVDVEEYGEAEQELRAGADRNGEQVRRPADARPVPINDDGDDAFNLIPCREPAPSRDAICYNGHWSTGERCDTTRECSDDAVCLAPRDRHCFFVEEQEEPIECPRGSVGPEVLILCAPGYELTQITRDGCVACLPVEEECEAVENCRRSDLSFEECVVRIVGSRARAAAILERAESIDISPEEVLETLACGESGQDEVRPIHRERRAPARRAASGQRAAR